MQQLMIQGNLTREPEMGSTPEGVRVCHFDVAANTYLGNGQERTDYFRVTAWREMAESCGRYLGRGSSVIVTGTVTARGYLGRDEKPRAGMELRADRVHFLGGRRQDDELPY